MPLYCYYDPETGDRIELLMSIDEMLAKGDDDAAIVHEGRYLRRDFVRETGGRINTAWSNPLASDAVGVNPDQIPEAIEHSRKIGVPIEFNRDGQALFTSRGHRKRYCEAIGFVDNDGGYGDPQVNREEEYQGETSREEPLTLDDYNF